MVNSGSWPGLGRIPNKIFKYLNTGYCIHELKNIKILFGILPRPGQLPEFTMTVFYFYDRTHTLGLNHVYDSLSLTSSPNSCWVLSILLCKHLMHLLFPMSTTSALVQSLPPFNYQPPSNRSITSTQGVCLPLPALSLTVTALSMIF